MKQRNIIFAAIVLLTSLFAGSLAKGTKNVFQRRLDIDDDTPLTHAEGKLLKRLLNRGVIQAGEVAVSYETGRRKLKGTKGSKKQKKTPEVADSSSTNTRPPKLIYIPASLISNATHSGKGGKGGKAKSSKKTSKKCKRGKGKGGKGKGKSSKGTSKTSKSSKKSSKGYCEAEEVELLELMLFFAHQNHSSVTIPDGLSDSDWGTVYIYNANAFMAHHSSPIITNSSGVPDSDYTSYSIKNEDLIGNVTGSCTRIDSDGKAFCEFTYGFYDSDGYTYLTAEGVLNSDSDSGTLAVTGGTGIFRRVVGQLMITPKPGPDSEVYIEIFGNLWLDSRVVDRKTYERLTATS